MSRVTAFEVKVAFFIFNDHWVCTSYKPTNCIGPQASCRNTSPTVQYSTVGFYELYILGVQLIHASRRGAPRHFDGRESERIPPCPYSIFGISWRQRSDDYCRRLFKSDWIPLSMLATTLHENCLDRTDSDTNGYLHQRFLSMLIIIPFEAVFTNFVIIACIFIVRTKLGLLIYYRASCRYTQNDDQASVATWWHGLFGIRLVFYPHLPTSELILVTVSIMVPTWQVYSSQQVLKHKHDRDRWRVRCALQETIPRGASWVTVEKPIESMISKIELSSGLRSQIIHPSIHACIYFVSVSNQERGASSQTSSTSTSSRWRWCRGLIVLVIVLPPTALVVERVKTSYEWLGVFSRQCLLNDELLLSY